MILFVKSMLAMMIEVKKWDWYSRSFSDHGYVLMCLVIMAYGKFECRDLIDWVMWQRSNVVFMILKVCSYYLFDTNPWWNIDVMM